jgi:ATP-binding cassette subfamily C protein CydD
LENYYARYVPRSILAVLSPLFLLLVVFPVNWVVGVILLLATPVIPFYMALIGMDAEAISSKQLATARYLSGYFLDRLQGLATLKGLGYGEQELERISVASHELGKRTMAVLRVAFLSSAVLEFFSTFAIAIVATYIGLSLLGYLSFGVGAGGMTLQAGLYLLLLAPAYFQPLRTFAATYHDRADALAACESLVALTSSRRPEEQEVPGRIVSAVPGDVKSIDLRDVTVQYPGMARPVLDNVRLSIDAGQKIAVVGPSGAGKSTLLGILAGQVRATSGTLLLNGTPLVEQQVDTLRSAVSWIGQRPYLFPGTIASNIALGQPDIERERIEAAARQAGVLDFASALPAGLDTVIGERGWGLSGGEAQRVALARAFLKDAPIIILDEPTAHLDPATEQALLHTITQLASGRILLVATHNPALIDICDIQVEVHDGQLIARMYVEEALYA